MNNLLYICKKSAKMPKCQNAKMRQNAPKMLTLWTYLVTHHLKCYPFGIIRKSFQCFFLIIRKCLLHFKIAKFGPGSKSSILLGGSENCFNFFPNFPFFFCMTLFFLKICTGQTNRPIQFFLRPKCVEMSKGY